MTAGELKRRFLKSLEDALQPQDFYLVRDPFYGLSFMRDIDDIRHFFELSVKKSGDGVEVANLFVGVRFGSVERKVVAYEDEVPGLGEKDPGRRRRTLGTHLGWSKRGFLRKEWTVRDEPTLAKALKEVVNLLQTQGFPFLDRYSRPEEAMRVLAADDEEARGLAGPDDQRAKGAIALALLTEGPASVHAIKNKKLAFLASSNRDRYVEVSRWADKLFAAENPAA